MKIRFKQLTRVTAYLNVCEFSGRTTQQIWEFDPGEEFEILSLTYGPHKKIKTRPDRPGGRVRQVRISLKNENSNRSTPDYLDDVLESDFEIL